MYIITSVLYFWHFWKIFGNYYNLGPDRLELIIFDITGKKIDNHRSRLIIELFL